MPLVITTPFRTTPFSPLDVPGMRYWFDFNDTSTLFQDVPGTVPVTANGQPVGHVVDKEPGFNDFMRASLGFPTWNSAGQNGLGTVFFQAGGVLELLQMQNAVLLPQPLTYFIASTTPAISARSFVTDQFGCGGARFAYYSFASGPVSVFNGVVLPTTLPFSTFRTVTIELNATTTVWNQTAIDTTGNAGPNGQNVLQLGADCNTIANQGPGFHIGEIICYSTPPSASDRLKIQNYLINKWGA